jgi:prolyl oligopeptidase
VEKLHGVDVPDPYRWLENGDQSEVQDWVLAQNEHTRAILDQVPSLDRLRRRIAELLALTITGPPLPRKGRYFFTMRHPRQNQPEIRLRRGLEGEDEVLLDVDALSQDGTVALDWWFPSPDGRLMAYGLSEAGDEMSTLYVLDVDRRERLADVIPYTRHCSLAWLPDGSGFYYTRHPEKGDVPDGDETYYARVFFHRLGEDWRKDVLAFGEGRAKTDIPSVTLSPDGRTLVLNVFKGSADYTDVYMQSPIGEGPFVAVVEDEPNITFGRAVGEHIYLTTNIDAPNYRLCRVPVADPARENWKEIIPEKEQKLEGGVLVGGRIFAIYLRDAVSMVVVHDADGGGAQELKLPGLGSVSGFQGEWDGDEAFFGFTSFHVPLTVYRIEVSTGTRTVFSRTEAPVNMDAFEVEQVWFQSPDGTKVPMFVGRRKGTPLDGSLPALLSGYGGFNISLTPYFSLLQVVWMEAGGVFAVANLRGGGEFGETWHKAGMLENKQNVFDDFIAAAEHLVKAGYTSPERLALMGGSNGGLLVSAALVQRPDIAAAIVCSVPVIDMLRYHRFLLARYWMGEYGDPDNPEHFPFLLKYSPYHNVKDGQDFPAVFFRTAESDSRVDPMHAMKMAALVQTATSSKRPVLFWMNRKAGHGIGMPKEMMVRNIADEMAFLFWQLGMEME